MSLFYLIMDKCTKEIKAIEFKLDKYSVFYPNGNFFLNREAYFCAAKIKRKETDDARQY